MWSQLSYVDTIVTCGHNYHMWSPLSHVVTIVTCGHNCHTWSQLSHVVTCIVIAAIKISISPHPPLPVCIFCILHYHILRYVSQICSGCLYIHQKKILHRDLKLGNMFLTFDNTVKIGDFGLAITLEAQSKISTETKCGTLCGTPNYIAPEVLMKKGHIRESDYWAIGCMTYALLIGHPPFETDTLKQVSKWTGGS